MSALVRGSALIAILLLSGVAAGQQPAAAPSKQAQQLFKDGLALVVQEKWTEAEAKFEQAWALNPSVSVAANLGQVQARLKKHRQAAEHLEFALRYWPATGQDDKRQRTELRLTEVKREIGTLRVSVSPAGALVLVNGTPMGAAPIDHDLYVDAGAVEVRAEREGLETERVKLTIEKGKSYQAALSLKPAQSPARAAEPRSLGPADEADLHFRRGADAYQRGDLEVALEHFLHSNRLVPNRNVIFDIARVYEQLKRWADAHRYYVEALRGETNAQTIEDITGALKRIAPNVAVLEILTDPGGATIYLDRKDLGARGETPVPLALPEGKYRVIAELAGYEPATLEGALATLGSTTPVKLSLKRIVGNVLAGVEGAPSADVRVDDENGPRACEAPCTLELPPGPHVLYFVRPGYEVAPRQVVVVANESLSTTASMTPLTGSLSVSTDERDAVIEIDGTPVGFTPSVVPNVPVGRRSVRIRLQGYAPVEQDVDIQPNKQSQLIDVHLTALREVAAASRNVERIDDAPSSVTIIDRQEIRAFGYPTIAEALRGTRGIALSYDRVYWSAAIRGLGDPRDYNNRLLVLQDGTVMNDNILAASFIGNDARADLDDVDRIEVVRGPGSLVYGTGAMSGVVNLVPRGKEGETSGHVGAGTYENGTLHARTGFYLNFNKAKTAGMWASLSGARSSGFNLDVEPRAAPGTTETAHQVDFFRSYGTAGRIWAGPITAQWFFHSREQTVTTAPFGMRFDDARTLYKDQRFMAEVRAEPKISESIQILARAYAQHYSYHGNYVYSPPPAPGLDEDYTGTWVGGEARTVVKPMPSLRLTLGGEVQGDPEANMIGCGAYELNGNKCPTDDRDTDEDGQADTYLEVQQGYVTGAVYGQADWDPAKWLHLSAGARVDFSSLLEPQGVGRGAVIVKPWTGGVIKLMGGNAFRRPSIFERFYWDGGYGFVQAEDPADPGNTKKDERYVEGGLKAETIVTGEIEISQRFLEDWTALGSVHVNRIENVITAVKVQPGQPDSVTQFQNSESPAFNAGFDVEIRRDFRQGWMLSAFYGYQQPQFIGLDANSDIVKRYENLLTNPRLTNAPEHLAGLRGVVPIVPGLASLGLRISLEGPRRVTYTDNPDTKDVDESAELTKPAAVGDITLSGNVKRFGVEYVVGVYNVGDQRYNLPISESYYSRLSPQNGRTFLAKINVTYP